MRSNVLPENASPDHANQVVRHSVHCSDLALREIGFANRNHIGVSQFRYAVGGTSLARRPSFGCSISHIVGICSYKQVFERPARRIIAAMKDMLPFRYWAVSIFPSQAVNAANYAKPPHVAVAFTVGASRPNSAPVRIRRCGVVIKSLAQRPMTWALELFRFWGNHFGISSADVARAARAFAVPGGSLLYSTKE